MSDAPTDGKMTDEQTRRIVDAWERHSVHRVVLEHVRREAYQLGVLDTGGCVDYKHDQALHPHEGDEDICARCGEHRSWHDE